MSQRKKVTSITLGETLSREQILIKMQRREELRRLFFESELTGGR